LLDDVQKLIADYNREIGATINPALDVLTLHLGKAISTWIESERFKEWDQKSSREQMGQNIPYDHWNNYLKSRSANSGIPKDEAKIWLGQYQGLGWLVAGDGNEAAAHIRNGYLMQGNISVLPDIFWFQEIIIEAWPELDNLQEIKEARAVAEALQIKVREAENLLESGIRFIRDQYEGGKPPV
jgi:hypothetical protein